MSSTNKLSTYRRYLINNEKEKEKDGNAFLLNLSIRCRFMPKKKYFKYQVAESGRNPLDPVKSIDRR